MKTIKIFMTLALFLVVGMSCGSKTSKTEKLQSGDYYTCTMHPEIHEEKPGDCPKCGMKLVLNSSISSGENDQMDMSNDSSSMNMPKK